MIGSVRAAAPAAVTLLALPFAFAPARADLPPPATSVEDVLARAAAECADFEDGVFDAADAVTRIDLTGDGTPDALVDESRFACSSAASLYCGSGGCMLHAIVGDSATTWQATGWRRIEWTGPGGALPILLIGRDGVWCGGAGSEVCFEALTWSDGRFLSVKPAD